MAEHGVVDRVGHRRVHQGGSRVVQVVQLRVCQHVITLPSHRICSLICQMGLPIQNIVYNKTALSTRPLPPRGLEAGRAVWYHNLTSASWRAEQ